MLQHCATIISRRERKASMLLSTAASAPVFTMDKSNNHTFYMFTVAQQCWLPQKAHVNSKGSASPSVCNNLGIAHSTIWQSMH
jgi:hypothetical protein